MFTVPRVLLDRFARDTRGVVTITFTLTLFAVIMFMACAIDYSRALTVRMKIGAAVDAASILAAKRMKDGVGTIAEIETAARTLFDVDMASALKTSTVTEFKMTPNADNTGVTINAKAQLPTTFARIAGIKTMDVGRTATAIFNQQNIEVGLQLDVTGSMGGVINREVKIDALKTASKNLLDILLPSGGSGSTKVRVGIAPFAAGVNAGSFARTVAGVTAPGNCVYERRSNFSDATDNAPTGSDVLKTLPDLAKGAQTCPTNAQVAALTDDKATLVKTVNSLTADGSTAGHLGTSWAWYLLSPNWSSIWPSASKPADYNDGSTLKFAILMTDGIYNTVGGISHGDSGAEAVNSQQRAKDLCDGMKARNIRIYTVGFIDASTPASAADTLKYCASDSSKFFKAEDGAQLNTAFRNIAQDIARLRLSK